MRGADSAISARTRVHYTQRELRHKLCALLLSVVLRAARRCAQVLKFPVKILRHDTKILKFHAQTAARFAAWNFKSYVQKQLARAE